VYILYIVFSLLFVRTLHKVIHKRAAVGSASAKYCRHSRLLTRLWMLLWTETYDELFSRVVSILPLSDRINRMHSQKLNDLKLTSPDISAKFPELHIEVYDGQP